jgi:hypothetical protein
VVSDGTVYFGSDADEGNTDETVKFPSAVALLWRWTGDNSFRDHLYAFARRGMRTVWRELDTDGDGWPEGLGNVEREGMGEEKLDVAVYTIRGLLDLARPCPLEARPSHRPVGPASGPPPAWCLRARLVDARRARFRGLATGPTQPPGLPAPLDRRASDGS